jgi:hypothetical protein
MIKKFIKNDSKSLSKMIQKFIKNDSKVDQNDSKIYQK